jgi:hypothetical protein
LIGPPSGARLKATKEGRMAVRAAQQGRRGQLERFTEDQEMLTLSLCSYRGFAYFTPVVMRRRDLRRSTTEALEVLEPLAGRFHLLWGPATFRAPLTALDDSAMFVVADAEQADRYVVVIRGTNPVSAFDWVFGDFWTARTVPWDNPGTRTDVRVSLSTALGLAVLRLMRAPAGESRLARAAWRVISEHLSDPLRRTAGKPMSALNISSSLLARLSPLVRSRLARVERSLQVLPADPEDRIQRLVAAWDAPAVEAVLHQVDAALEAPVDDAHMALLRLLTGSARIRSLLTPGPDLAGLLSTLAAGAEGTMQVDVVGHSKGGALASTLALWLAESQEETWDPSGRAVVRCFSFAGPTAGNRGFADRIDDVLGARHRRVANTLDIVPHAWVFRGHGNGPCVEDIVDLYPPPVHRIGALEQLTGVVAAKVAPLDYQHTRANVYSFEGRVAPAVKPWLAQVSHQHLDGYIAGMGLEGTLDARWFFQLG